MDTWSKIWRKVVLFEETLALAKTVIRYDIRGKTAISHGDVEWLSISRASQ
jgi:hypothetical protein